MRTLIISDIHIGDKRYNTTNIIKTLEKQDFNRLILNGDIVDLWVEGLDEIKKDPFISFIKEISKTKEVVWILGNHDKESDVFGDHVKILDRFEFNYQNNKFLVTHGNEVYSNKNDSKLDRFLAKINHKLYQWTGINIQEQIRRSSLYKNRARKMRRAILNKYNGLFHYIIMGHTHVLDYICSNNTVLLDAGSPQTTKTYILVHDDKICLKKVEK